MKIPRTSHRTTTPGAGNAGSKATGVRAKSPGRNKKRAGKHHPAPHVTHTIQRAGDLHPRKVPGRGSTVPHPTLRTPNSEPGMLHPRRVPGRGRIAPHDRVQITIHILPKGFCSSRLEEPPLFLKCIHFLRITQPVDKVPFTPPLDRDDPGCTIIVSSPYHSSRKNVIMNEM